MSYAQSHHNVEWLEQNLGKPGLAVVGFGET